MKKRKQGLFLSAILILTLAACPTAALAAEPEEGTETAQTPPVVETVPPHHLRSIRRKSMPMRKTVPTIWKRYITFPEKMILPPFQPETLTEKGGHIPFWIF